MRRENLRSTGFSLIATPDQIVSIDFSGGVLFVAKILEGLTKIKGLLPGLACSNEFCFGSRQRDVVLRADLLRDRSTVHHEDRAGVWGLCERRVTLMPAQSASAHPHSSFGVREPRV